MPIGILVNVCAVVIGGLVGTWVGPKLSRAIQEKLNCVFGICAMSMGVTLIVLLKNLPPVILSVIVGLVLGHLIHLDERIRKGGMLLGKRMSRLAGSGKELDADKINLLITAVVLFCASGTGIYGSMVSGMTGDHSILLAKAILDLPTALIFACSLGLITCVIAIPQLIIFLALFFLSGLIYPFCTPDMIGDFKACGGILLLATGFRMLKLKDSPIADMIPAMLLVMPLSALWESLILPLL